MGRNDFADRRYVAILGDSGRASDVPGIVDCLGNEFNGDVGRITVNPAMGGKVIANYRDEEASASFGKIFGDKTPTLWRMARDFSGIYSSDGKAWVCPRIVVADVTPNLCSSRRVEKMIGEKYGKFLVLQGKVQAK